MLKLVHFAYVILSFSQTQYKSRRILQIKRPSGQSSVPTVARDKCIGKSNKRLHIWPSSPNTLLNPQGDFLGQIYFLHLIAASGVFFSSTTDLFFARQGFGFFAFPLSFAEEFDRSTTYVVKKHLLLSLEPLMPPISRQTSLSIC